MGQRDLCSPYRATFQRPRPCPPGRGGLGLWASGTVKGLRICTPGLHPPEFRCSPCQQGELTPLKCPRELIPCICKVGLLVSTPAR